MKPFDINLAKQGAAVCTRDGHKVKIVSFTMHNERPILAILTLSNGREYPVAYFVDGAVCKRKSLKNIGHEADIFTEQRNQDLMMEDSL